MATLDGGTIAALVEARHGDPFAVLGIHQDGKTQLVRALVPGATAVDVVDPTDGKVLGNLTAIHPDGLFEGAVKGRKAPFAYRLRASNPGGSWEFDDPYRYGPVLGSLDDYLFGEGNHQRLWERLGAHAMEHEGAAGVHFAVWAPNASRAAVVGDFNRWDGRLHTMRKRIGTGIWEIFVPGVGEGTRYKYELKDASGGILPLKADPVGFAGEFRPDTASVVARVDNFPWSDETWLGRRGALQSTSAPISVYEVHLGSWRRADGDRFLTYDELAEQLVPYVVEMGFTHLELLPVCEHPFDGSWGYQPVGLFAPTSRFGDPAAFARLVDACHAAGIGLLVDWVPGHFPTDAHGLGRFDGTALYEHEDPRQGFHQDWNTLIYNFGRAEVTNFLVANALFWLERYHVDGLRVDAVASMLYLDYSRKAGEWIPNQYGGNQNLEAIGFMRKTNELGYGLNPGIVTIAEESTSYPGVSRPVWAGGLGFGFKWNMGWMNDTLDYMSHDPIHRRYHHHKMTFGLLYAFSENFLLPLSHDEVVHGKGSLLARMPGDGWQKFANLRAYYGFMWGHPGKKLLFMGQEFAQGQEWKAAHSLDWHLLDHEWHVGVKLLVKDLNQLYRSTLALHQLDCDHRGFAWIDSSDSENSVFAWLRMDEDGARPVAVISNFTPVPRPGYRLGLPFAGRWEERLNTDAAIYGGSNVGNNGSVMAEAVASHGRPYSAVMTLPPLGTVFLEYVG